MIEELLDRTFDVGFAFVPGNLLMAAGIVLVAGAALFLPAIYATRTAAHDERDRAKVRLAVGGALLALAMVVAAVAILLTLAPGEATQN